MVKSASIKNVLEEEEEPDSIDNDDEDMRTRTRKAAAVNIKKVNKYLWPNSRVPYTFHPFVSELLNNATQHTIQCRSVYNYCSVHYGVCLK